MKRITAISTAILVLHTIEESIFHFWSTDPFTIGLNMWTHISPWLIYTLGQILLYLFLSTMLFFPFQNKKPGQVILGVILLFEFEHVVISIQTGKYEAGLITGIILGLWGLLYWIVLIKKLKASS